jgi:hypothetical protein
MAAMRAAFARETVESERDVDDAEPALAAAPAAPAAASPPPKRPRLPAPCGVCGAASGRYRCANEECALVTCSAGCWQRHRDERGCSGVQSRTRFVALREFSDKVLADDVAFLEELARVSSRSERDPRARSNRRAPLSRRQQELLRQCEQRGVSLRFLPRGMQRQRENTSRYSFASRRVEWRVELLIGDERVVDERVDEALTWRELLARHLDPAAPGAAVTRHRFPALAAAFAAGDAPLLFMRVAGRPANQPVFHQLDAAHSLRDALAGKTLIEFPSVHVALPSEAARFPLFRAAAPPPPPPQPQPQLQPQPLASEAGRTAPQ